MSRHRSDSRAAMTPTRTGGALVVATLVVFAVTPAPTTAPTPFAAPIEQIEMSVQLAAIQDHLPNLTPEQVDAAKAIVKGFTESGQLVLKDAPKYVAYAGTILGGTATTGPIAPVVATLVFIPVVVHDATPAATALHQNLPILLRRDQAGAPPADSSKTPSGPLGFGRKLQGLGNKLRTAIGSSDSPLGFGQKLQGLGKKPRTAIGNSDKPVGARLGLRQKGSGQKGLGQKIRTAVAGKAKG